MVGTLPPQAASRQCTQLCVDRFSHAVVGLPVPVAPRNEQARHIRRLGHRSPADTPLYSYGQFLNDIEPNRHAR